jgi:hypothetical protein
VLVWLDTVLGMSGLNRKLDRILAELEPRMKEVEERIFPAVKKIEEIDRQWGKENDFIFCKDLL